MTVKGHAACTAVEPARAGSGGGKYIGIAVWCANQLATKFSLNVTFINTIHTCKSISFLIGNYNIYILHSEYLTVYCACVSIQ